MVPYSPRNYYGQIISKPFQLASPDFGTGMVTNGIPVVDWSGHRTTYADEHGFDKPNIEKNGQYTIQYTLPKGTKIVRYGAERGHYSAPENTRFEEVALPYTIESVEYHEYRVIAKGLRVRCIVEKGKVAPMFNQPGGGVQYLHNTSILELIRENKLERIQ